MIGKIFKQILLLIAAIALIFGCSTEKMEYEEIPAGIEFKIDGLTKQIQFYSDRTLMVTVFKSESISEEESLVVNRVPGDVDVKIKQANNFLVLQTSELKLEIDVETGAIRFLDHNDQVLLQEENEHPQRFFDTSHAYAVGQHFQLTDNEGVYGLGQFQDGYMNYRGKEILLVQANKVSIVPFLVSTNNYGILWDNYSRSLFKDDESGTSFSAEIADKIDYYFVAGENMDEAISGYRFLTGKAPMFSKAAYGYWQSKERYVDGKDLISTVEKYRNNNIPIDNIVQDWRYWGDNEYWSSMRWDPETFPEPEKLIDELHNKYHVRIMTSIWPALGPSTDIYKEMEEKGFLFDKDHWCGGKIYDPYSEEAREIYFRYIQEGLLSKGVDALWMDGTEPELSHTNDREYTEKEIKDCGDNAMGSMAQYLNTYSLMTTKGTYEGQRKLGTEKRIFTLTRSAFAGQQRHAAVTWSGDVIASWEVYKKQISGGVNFSMAGIPYWTHDIGAFFPGHPSYGGDYPEGIEDPAYQELYVRWFQFGAFSPIFRSHGTGTPREVWRFGKKGDQMFDALMTADNLRYRLIPYIYSNAWMITEYDYTLMRGMMMDFPKDMGTYNINDQYLFGANILVKPVTVPMFYLKDTPAQTGKLIKNPNTSVETYLPDGVLWFDFWTGEQQDGGQNIAKECPMDILPLYIKAGSILPLGPFIQYTGEKPADPIELRIYAGADASFLLYEDEDDNYNYEEGVYATIKFHWNDANQTLTIGERKGEFPGMLEERTFNIAKVKPGHGAGVNETEQPDQVITYSGEKVEVVLD